MDSLQRSYWPADTAEPVLETTVGSILRERWDAGAFAVIDAVG